MKLSVPSFRNVNLVRFVTGVLIGAMALIGGPVTLAADRNEAGTTEEAGCAGPIGSSTAPLGECSGNVSQADVKAVQTELWASIFGTKEDPNLSYNMAPGTVFKGRGDYKGVNAYGDSFLVHVYYAVDAFKTQVNNDSVVGWNVFGTVLGPTGVAVPIIGLVMDVSPINGPNGAAPTPAGVGFVMAGKMSADMNNAFKAGEAGEQAANAGGLTDTQKQCAAACDRTKDAQLIVAAAALAAALLIATTALAVALLACAAALGFPPLGLLLGSACALAAMTTYAAACAAAAIIFSAALVLIMANYINCMAACGIIIVQA